MHNKTYLRPPHYQQGVAALIVTLLISLIATVATVYTSKNSLLTQKGSSNNAQNMMAMQAAEEGIQTFVQQIRDDLAAIEDGAATGVVLMPDPDPTASTSCDPGGAALPFMFTATYHKGTTGTDKLVFKDDKFFDRPAAQSEMVRVVAETNLGLNYRVKAIMVGRDMFISSTGLAAGGSEATVRKQITLNGGMSLGDSAMTVGGYFDMALAAHITANAGSALAKCSVNYGDSYAITGTENYKCFKEGDANGQNCPASQSDKVKTGLFESVFSKSKAELKASLPPSQILASCNGPIAGIPNKYLWIEGDATNCVVSGENSIVIVNGNIIGGIKLVDKVGVGGAIEYKADGVVYAKNAYLDGETDVTGSIYIENAVDVAELGTPITHIGGGLAGTTTPNTKLDGQDADRSFTHSGQGSLKITYKKYSGSDPDPDKTATSINSSWIDF